MKETPKNLIVTDIMRLLTVWKESHTGYGIFKLFCTSKTKNVKKTPNTIILPSEEKAYFLIKGSDNIFFQTQKTRTQPLFEINNSEHPMMSRSKQRDHIKVFFEKQEKEVLISVLAKLKSILPKYNHTYDLSISINLDSESGEDLIGHELKSALLKKIESMDYDEIQGLVDYPYDSYNNF